MSQSRNASRRRRRKKRLTRRQRFIRFISIIVILVSFFAFGYHQLMNSQLLLESDKTKGETNLDDSVKSQVKDSVNILVCGIDDDDNRDSGLLTDTIMILHWDVKGNSAKVLQIPRDTFVGNVTYTGKINSIYNNQHNDEIKGIVGLANQIHTMFQIPIDYYATITMKGFRNVIDQMGGVEFESPQSFTIDGVNIQKGRQVFYGVEAEKFVRYRSGYKEGDLGRLNAQRMFFSAVIEKMLRLGKGQMVKIVPTVIRDVTTDMTLNQALDLAEKGASLDTSSIQFFMLPGETVTKYKNVPCYKEYGGQDLYTIHKQSVADMLNQHFRPYTDPVPAESLKCIEIANTDSTHDNSKQTVDEILT